MTNSKAEHYLNQLNDSYEDQLFRIVINNFTAEAEGEKLLGAYAAEAAEEPPPLALKKFITRVNKYTKEQRVPARREGRPRRFLNKAAVVLLTAIALFSLALLTVDAFRVQVLNVLMNIESKYTDLQITDDNSASQGNALLVNWKNAYVPSYVPDGYEIIALSNIDSVRSIKFGTKDKSSLFVFSEYSSSYGMSFDTEKAGMVETITINGNKGTVVNKDSIVTVAWIMDNHLFNIQGNISDKEAIKIAESVEFVK
ncbi:protein of unknown function [Sporobacter termitidis DSM 10068]|uniref:DUF4367 domain-containing protein n=1 Tax=Sporobacter termitidis DSM 10068 TaxID=1123282 RepID=A0A1M5ZGA5_9FIRM|nr:DUF4367 domain-containing protein [Sporobacter termitidis]SHI23277.1 protein of unknown function [Sporobacter termitidis DSM 10068]